jgi:hypothetical protein
MAVGDGSNRHTCNNRGPVGSSVLCVVHRIWAKCALDERPSIFIRDKPIFLSERMLHEDYYLKGLVEKKIYAHES